MTKGGRLVGRVWRRALHTAGYRVVRTRPSRQDLAHDSTDESTPIEGQEDLRFRFHQWVYDAPIELMVGRSAYSYGRDGWHPFVAAAREVLADPEISYEESVLRKLYEGFTPETVAQLQFPGEAAAIDVLDRIPAHTRFDAWLLREPPYSSPLDAPRLTVSRVVKGTVRTRQGGSRLNGPVTRQQGVDAHERLKRRVAGLSKYGYRPNLFTAGRIRVIVLRHDGAERYLVVHGQHRVGILAAMAHERLEVAIAPGMPPVIDSADAEEWPHVRSGLISADDAVTQLSRYFVPGLGSVVRDMVGAGA